MWNFFIRDSFPYIVKEELVSYSGYSLFSLNNGTKKTNGEKVSVFCYKKELNRCDDLSDYARIAVKKLKKFKHPSILTYVDSHEDDNFIYLVTAHCLPLFAYLHKLGVTCYDAMYLKWGIASVGDAVEFLNNIDLRHNNIFHGSVFVNDQGNWQLGELSYLTAMDSDYPVKHIRILEKYIPPQCCRSASTDEWGLGILLWETFNGELDCSGSLKSAKDIPSELHLFFKQLTTPQKIHEKNISKFIDNCRCKNLLWTTLDNLNNYHLKEREVKTRISRDILKLLSNIPKDIVLYKILPLLRQAYEFDDENGSYLVPVVAKISALVNEEEFQNQVEAVVTLFVSSNDRATRLTLLANIEEIVRKLDKKNVNNLYPILCTGFLDTTPQIRDETVKAMVHIAPKLSKKTLNQDLLRHLTQVQAKDDDHYLRTNATICLANIAHCLDSSSRQRVLISALLNALNDCEHTVRNAAVRSLAFTHRFYPVDLLAKGVLPRLVCLTVDPDAEVRKNVFQTARALLLKLEDVSNFPQITSDVEKEVASDRVEDGNSWTKWALAAITGKLSNDAKTNTVISEDRPAPENEMKPNVLIREPSAPKETIDIKSNVDMIDEEECRDSVEVKNELTFGGTHSTLRKRPGPMKLGRHVEK